MNQTTIRSAEKQDAQAMIHVLHAAVRGIAPHYYSPKILAAWSGVPDAARYQWMEGMLAQQHAVSLVAELSDHIAGFCIFMADEGLVRALYVHPEAGSLGVGSRLLEAVDNLAVVKGVSRLWVNSSLNAEQFYRRNGFTVLAPGKFPLRDGLEMDCLKMEKQL